MLRFELGAGRNGVVYAATQISLGRFVAIKMMGAEPGDLEARQRFLNEAAACARLVHRNIVGVYDFGETEDGELFLVMEYLQGETLKRALKTAKRFSSSETVTIASQVARALRLAHANGVIHRDLKPENIMLAPEEDDPSAPLVPRILDFGVAKMLCEARGVTQPGFAVGSPTGMAPEQIRGGELCDGRTDIYALGVLMYRMISGRAPFLGASREVMRQHLSSPVPPFDRALAVPAAIEAVIMKCLAKDPEQRFASMDDVLRALEPKAQPPQLAPKRSTALVALSLASATFSLAFTLTREPQAMPAPSPAIVVVHTPPRFVQVRKKAQAKRARLPLVVDDIDRRWSIVDSGGAR